VAPVVAEVVPVAEPAARCGESEQLRSRFVLHVIAAPVRVGCAVAGVTDLELVQVRVGPPHGSLNDVVQLGEGHLAGYQHAAPHRRAYGRQCDLELEDLGLRCDPTWRSHARMLPAPAPLSAEPG
jgi:hypothetical protein